MKKKIFAILLCACLLLTIGVTAYATEGNDDADTDEVDEVTEAAATDTETPDETEETDAEATAAAATETAETVEKTTEAEAEATAETAADTAETEEENVAEEPESSAGIPGPYKALIAGTILLVLGFGVVALGNRKIKGPKKPKQAKEN